MGNLSDFIFFKEYEAKNMRIRKCLGSNILKLVIKIFYLFIEFVISFDILGVGK